MQSLIQDVLKPATVALLDALDSAMNSNSMFFKVRADKPLTPDNDQRILNKFVRSALFPEIFLEFAWLRQPGYLIPDDYIDAQFTVRSLTGHLIPTSAYLELTNSSERAFAERLHWMLTTAPSPYQKHRSEQNAQEIIGNFFGEIFTPESWPLEESGKQRYWSKHSWTFYDITPNFLHSTGYFHAPEEYEPPEFAYFDGGEADTCTFFYKDDVFYLLLTNGSP